MSSSDGEKASLKMSMKEQNSDSLVVDLGDRRSSVVHVMSMPTWILAFLSPMFVVVPSCVRDLGVEIGIAHPAKTTTPA